MRADTDLHWWVAKRVGLGMETPRGIPLDGRLEDDPGKLREKMTPAATQGRTQNTKLHGLRDQGRVWWRLSSVSAAFRTHHRGQNPGQLPWPLLAQENWSSRVETLVIYAFENHKATYSHELSWEQKEKIGQSHYFRYQSITLGS